MFTDKELESTKDLCGRKIKDILDDTEKPFTAESLRDLQTLFTLKDAAEKKISGYQEVD